VSRPVTLINSFTVPPEESERFLGWWKATASIMAGQQGLIRARLHRALDDDTQPRFVNVAAWDSGTALDAARANPEFQAAVQRMVEDPNLHVTPLPAVYEVAVDVGPGDAL
jgi:heme-degrading monooxygenase HmoA